MYSSYEESRRRKKLITKLIQAAIIFIVFAIMMIVIPTKPIPENSPNLYNAAHERAIKLYGGK